MTEEKVAPAQPVEIHKPPMPFGERVRRMSDANLLGETRRIARQVKSHIDASYAIAIVLTQFKGARMGGDDPYCRKHKKRQAGTGGLILR